MSAVYASLMIKYWAALGTLVGQRDTLGHRSARWARGLMTKANSFTRMFTVNSPEQTTAIFSLSGILQMLNFLKF